MTDYKNNISPISLPRQALYSVRLNNLLLNKTMGYSFTLGNEELFRFRMLPGDLQVQSICPINLTLELGNTTAGLWLSDWPLVERIRAFIPEALLKKLPENLAISVIENAFEALWQQAEKGLGMKLSIQSMSAEADSSLYSLPFGFELQVMHLHTRETCFQATGLLVMEPKLYPHLQERLRFWPSATNEDWEQHQTPLRLAISHLMLSLQEINQLQIADLLLLEDTRFQQHGLIRLCLDSGYCCDTAFTDTHKTHLKIHTEWTPMSDNDDQQNIEHISHIPVQLSFDLGQKTLSFNEVRQLRPGYILELGMTLPEIVQIRSQHRQIGTGELVEVNGRIAVRILSLFNKKVSGS